MVQEVVEQSLKHEKVKVPPENSDRLTALITAISISIGAILWETQNLDKDTMKIRFFLDSLGIGK